jgi:RNA polymerase sigma-70 factor, ECF subfamily
VVIARDWTFCRHAQPGPPRLYSASKLSTDPFTGRYHFSTEHLDQLEDLMPTGPDHYREAERIMTEMTLISGGKTQELGFPEAMAMAQVHATLALAVAKLGNTRRFLPAPMWSSSRVGLRIVEPEDPASLGLGGLDPDSAQWVRALTGTGPERDDALARLHKLLVRVARSEARRRGSLDIAGPELDDLVHQAAADALVAITAKIGQFRGESRFTTWACKFAIFEVATKIGRHFWRHATMPMDAEDWDRLPDRFGLEPDRVSEWRDLIAALHRAVDTVLSDRQRRVFVAVVLNGVPLDVVAAGLGSNRNAIYKTLFDARRKLRAALAANGHLGQDTSRRT